MDVKVDGQSFLGSLAAELGAVLGVKIGAAASVAERAGGVAAGPGWAASVTVDGPIRGDVIVWFDQASLGPVMAAAEHLEAEPDAAAVLAFVTDLVTRAAAASADRAASGPVSVTPPKVEAAPAPATSATAFDITFEGHEPVSVVLSGDWLAAPVAPGVSANERLQAVLDVDLPLVVRFGGTVVPLRTLASLANGSMVDMNRAPDAPVDLIVGGRVIARGEVVVVSGHYGVRITELTNQTRPAAGAVGA